MTELLKKAFDAVSALPPERQDALSGLILAEIEDEKKWSEAFARSLDKLADMANEAVAEHKAGKTRSMDEVLRSVRLPADSGRLLNNCPPGQRLKQKKSTSSG